jgi:hypothetical protein
MTRRIGYWIIGTALGLPPLAGCAQWGTTGTSPDADCAQLMAFWDRQFRGPSTSIVAQATETDNVPIAHESKTLSSQELTGATKGIEQGHPPAEPVSVTQPPPILATAAPDLPKPLPVQPAVAAPPQIAVQAEPTPPVVPGAFPVRREPLVDALQYVIDNRPNDALQALRKYDQATQEVLLRLMPVLALMTQKSIESLSTPEVAMFNEQLQILSDLVRPHTKLAIDKACFCEWIKSYGIYKPLPEGHAFLGSTPNRTGEFVQLYVELRNFASEFRSGSYATRLSSSVEIRDQKGDKIWFYQFDDRKQPIRSQTLLHDYFNNYCFYVPSGLPAGTYTLTIQVTDETRPGQPRVASKQLEFRVTSMSARVP